ANGRRISRCKPPAAAISPRPVSPGNRGRRPDHQGREGPAWGPSRLLADHGADLLGAETAILKEARRVCTSPAALTARTRTSDPGRRRAPARHARTCRRTRAPE